MISHDPGDSTEGESEGKPSPLSAHILPTSATMIGVCITVVGLVRVIEATDNVSTAIDKIVAGDSLLFLTAAVMSYLSMRSGRRLRYLENYADVVFMVALGVLAMAGFLVAWEVGVTPSA
jgi:hypothetical protein